MDWEQIDWEQIQNIGKIILAIISVICTFLGAGFIYKKCMQNSIKQNQKAGDNSTQIQIGNISNSNQKDNK